MNKPDEPLLILENGVYRPTQWSIGPWGDLVQGSVTGALLAEALRRWDWGAPMVLAHLWFDLWRPVAANEIRLDVKLLRDGRKAKTAEAALIQGDAVVARCTALALRADAAETPEKLVAGADAERPKGPNAGNKPPPQVQAWSPYFQGVDTRVVEGDLLARGPAGVWLKLERPLVAGVPNSPLVQAVSAADLASGISSIVDIRRWSFVNADQSIQLWRAPAGDWVFVRARMQSGPAGTGTTLATLFDDEGAFGWGIQSVIFERRR